MSDTSLSTSSTRPSISVIIPTYRDGDRLRTCLRALDRQSLSPDQIEILLVNNDPANPVPANWLPRNARVIEEPRPGSYAARNTGARAASGRFLAFTDGDCVPDPRWAESALALLQSSTGSRVTGPIVIFREPGAGLWAYKYEFHTAFRQLENARRGHSTTANLFVPADVFRTVGPFDDDLLSGGDMEWSGRAHALGVPIVFADEVLVLHPARPSLQAIFAKRRRVAGSEALWNKISSRRYIRQRLKPPNDGRLKIDRAPAGQVERIILLAIMWALNLYGAFQFTAVRLGLRRPTRS